MAAKTAIGSASWIAAEKENVQQMLNQEKEELIFPAQHEMEWLNEHMADIFSNSQLSMNNVFKTPGKLRGKTPRTARKRNVAEARIPLSDVFSSKPYQRTSPAKAAGNSLRFAVAEDVQVDSQSLSQKQPPAKSQADSGYHGSSQIDEYSQDSTAPAVPPKSPLRTIRSPVIEEEEQRTTEGSFHSAKEDQTVKMTAPSQEVIQQDIEVQTESVHDDEPIQQEEPLTLHSDIDDIGSPSDESTPDRPVVRKGSMTFASLPPREALKTSIGARVSRTSHVDPNKARDSQYMRQPSTAAPDANEMSDYDEDASDVDMNDSHIEILGRDESELENQSMRQYSKATTQRLHDRIDMLGKGPEPRPSKSIPSAAALAALRRSVEEQEEEDQRKESEDRDEEDDWIEPLSGKQNLSSANPSSPAQSEAGQEEQFYARAPELIAHEERMNAYRSPSPQRPGYGHAKSASTATLASPAKFQMAPPPSPGAKSISVSNPAMSSTTPQGSPRRFMDLSASKSRLQSIMSSAKGLFTKSAGVSAAAKMEMLASPQTKASLSNMPGMYPSLDKLEDKPLPADPPVRKTRSSTEREKEEKRKERDAKAVQKMNDDLEKARRQEHQRAVQQHQAQSKPPSPQKSNERDEAETARPAQHGKFGRPVRPARDVSKTKPQPVSIKIGTLSHQRMPVNQAPVATHNQESLQGDPKRPGLQKQPSNQSMSSTSTTTFKTSVTAQPAKPRALLMAEKKKEQDEKEAQRKLEHKKEIERKRAALQEETKRKELREREEAERKERERVAEQQRKRQAQQEAIERKRQDAARKAEQQRQDRVAAHESQPARPPSRLGQQNISRPIVNHHPPTNPAKPPKRQLEEENVRPQAPRFGAASQQADAKRRRTEDEQREQPPRPTISGAPIRQSQMGKKPSLFNHPSYTQAPGPSHLSQFPQPPSRAHPQMQQMQQYATAKIPFAEPTSAHANNAPHPPAKTPLSSIRTIQQVKSSPQYQNGNDIALPDIPTDSEDEDSDDEAGNAFPLPSWATPGHLTEQLLIQEGMDGDAVFGPIAPLKMEEIFAKGNKDRLKNLRVRTSSANWAMSGDGLTLEEVRADREQRERMRIEGGWRYGTS